MNEGDLRKKILEAFEDELRSLGVDIELVQIVQTDKPPSEAELNEEKSALDYVGKLGQRFVWVMKRVVTVVPSVLVLYVTLMNLPDAVEKHKLNFPRSYRIAVDIGEKIKRGNYYDLEENEIRARRMQNEPEGLLIFKQDWMGNPASYEVDKSSFSNGDFDALMTTATSSFAVSGSSATSSDMVVPYISTEPEVT